VGPTFPCKIVIVREYKWAFKKNLKASRTHTHGKFHERECVAKGNAW